MGLGSVALVAAKSEWVNDNEVLNCRPSGCFSQAKASAVTQSAVRDRIHGSMNQQRRHHREGPGIFLSKMEHVPLGREAERSKGTS